MRPGSWLRLRMVLRLLLGRQRLPTWRRLEVLLRVLLPGCCQAAAVRTAAASSIPSFLLLLVPTQRSRVDPRCPPSLASRSDQSALLRHELTRADGRVQARHRIAAV